MLFTDLLDGHIAGKPTPSTILGIIAGPYAKLPVTDMIDVPEHASRECSLAAELRHYLARRNLGLNAYLARYHDVLTACWLAMKTEALSMPAHPSASFGMPAAMFPSVPRRAWIRQRFAPDSEISHSSTASPPSPAPPLRKPRSPRSR